VLRPSLAAVPLRRTCRGFWRGYQFEWQGRRNSGSWNDVEIESRGASRRDRLSRGRGWSYGTNRLRRIDSEGVVLAAGVLSAAAIRRSHGEGCGAPGTRRVAENVAGAG
jgi:hypothetical protein